jgi:hypothetical protein
VDVGLFASSDDLFLRDLFSWDVSSEGDVETNSSGVESGFLRDERDSTTVRLNVEVRDVLPVDDDATGERITVETEARNQQT